MKRAFSFTKKNFIELGRDPAFCVVAVIFPFIFIILLTLINKSGSSETGVVAWEFLNYTSLIPSTVVVSSALVMYFMAVLVSKDRKSSLLKRLYVSPMKTPEFLVGYFIIGVVIGIVLLLLSFFGGWLIAACFGDCTYFSKNPYFSFGQGMLLILSQIPILLTLLFFGILIGSFLDDKAAPGVCAILLILVGLLGGCFFSMESSGSFEIFGRCLPFYPSVYIGRVITGSIKSVSHYHYVWDDVCSIGIATIFAYLILNVVLSNVIFSIQCKRQ